GNPQQALLDKCVIDSGFSRHMTGNMSFLLEFEEINRGYVAFGGDPKGGFNTLFGEKEWGIFLKKMGHQLGYLQKVFYETTIEADITKKATDTLDSDGMRSVYSRWGGKSLSSTSGGGNDGSSLRNASEKECPPQYRHKIDQLPVK
nr:hypothetical protein [Tanacetum cinerariifolium]